MEEYAGRVLADRYRLPRIPAGEEPPEMAAFDTYSGQEVLVRQVPLPEVVSAEIVFGPGEDPPDLLSPADDPGHRALRAAKAAARLPDHPGLVQVYDVFLEGGALWIVSEWVPARPLAEVIAEKPLTPYRAAEIGADVLAALRAVHAESWTHRNVTAETVLLCDDGRAMLGGLCVAAAEEALCGNDPVPPEDGWDERGAAARDHARERARQARLGIVAPYTERWSPEQAGPVPSENGSPPRMHPDGPPADMWALGALLFRSVQGHPPFPEGNALELVDIVRTEPPAYAEECGPLRPVVESLLRKNPAERPGPEEVRGWLRSLIRTAPEPDVGTEAVTVPADPHKIVEVRRKGEVARRRRGEKALVHHGKHRGGGRGGPGRLGRVLIGVVVLAVLAALAYAALFMPEKDDGAGSEAGDPKPPATGSSEPDRGTPSSGGTSSLPDLSTDFAWHQDPMGFTLALHQDLRVRGETSEGQMWFDDGDDVRMIVVPGRDSASEYGDDVSAYQHDSEPELKPYREGDWQAAAGLTTFESGGNPAVEGEFTWTSQNRQYFGRNFAMLKDGQYHVIFVYGPERDRSDVSLFFEKAVETYRYDK